jgi:hypothetical protein
MANCNARLLNLLLRQARRETDLQRRLWDEDFLFSPGRTGGEGLVTGRKDALGETLNDENISKRGIGQSGRKGDCHACSPRPRYPAVVAAARHYRVFSHWSLPA